MPVCHGDGVALYMKEQLECSKLCLGMDEECVESLWVRIKGQTNMGNTVVGVYYKPLDQDEEVDGSFYRQLEIASRSQAQVLMGDFKYPDICGKDNTARHAEPQRFLQIIVDNFLTQVVDEPMRIGALLDLVLTNKEGLVGDVKDDCWVDEGRAVGTVYLDFSKAYDTVYHNVLTGKFRKYGLDERTVRWTESWLNGRAQRVVINGAESMWRPRTRGACQWSVWGPILSNINVNDLDKGTV
ncbi:hypothetical protein llap_18074 [Limosa lapponica baueri]|uniref:Uncharacterized protein n=1 Tax=Limosa lapponica baueri TaxID=1758121 RepID=A0A2I0TCX3_LIMLA|nr:hypothetical protein llap_18074 [Limosa lapponica baueri]